MKKVLLFAGVSVLATSCGKYKGGKINA